MYYFQGIRSRFGIRSHTNLFNVLCMCTNSKSQKYFLRMIPTLKSKIRQTSKTKKIIIYSFYIFLDSYNSCKGEACINIYR